MERQCAHSPPVANRVKVYIGKYIYKKDFVQVFKKKFALRYQWWRRPYDMRITPKMSSDRECHFFQDPSSSISDWSKIGQTGTMHSLLCLAVLKWQELMYSQSWDYKTNFYSYNTSNMLILACHVGLDMRSSCFSQVISQTMTGNQWNNDRSDRPGGPDHSDNIWALTDLYH